MVLPRAPMLDHGIEHGQELPHTRGQCHLLRFAICAEALVERADHRIPAGSGQGPHIQRGPHGGPPTPDGATAPQRAAGGDGSADYNHESAPASERLAEINRNGWRI